MIFHIPLDLPEDARDELERASIAGGQDGMPTATCATVAGGSVVLSRGHEESGCLLAPAPIDGFGRLMVRSASLMERPTPYELAAELARGKVNQVRNQTQDWLLGGLQMHPELGRAIAKATHSFGKAVTSSPDQAGELGHTALIDAHHAAAALVNSYRDQVFRLRHDRQPKLDTSQGVRLGATPSPEHEHLLLGAFNGVSIRLPWSNIEPVEGTFNWEASDRLVAWAQSKELSIIGGPLIDMSGRGLPDWLWEKASDLQTLSSYLCAFTDRAIERYRGKIRTWQVTAGSNYAGVLAEGDEELLWLTVRLAENVRKKDMGLAIVIGLSQPWGDYLATKEGCRSPFAFVDTLMRTGLKIAALDLEMVTGVWPRGSYCRDLLETSRILDLYAILGLPVHVTLGYPSAPGADLQADDNLKPGAGHWQDGFSPAAQASWASTFAELCLCKPYVQAVQWAHLCDADQHQFPHCGLIDADGKAKPALAELTALRKAHLK